MSDLAQLLQYLIDERGSDLLVKAGTPPHMRLDGHLYPVPLEALSAAEIEAVAAELLPLEKAEELLANGEVDIAYSAEKLGRFRVNVFRQRGALALAVRRVLPAPPAIGELNLPVVIEQLSEVTQGLVIVTGATANGKSTTVASMIDHINRTRACHIVTFEEPIEVLHEDNHSLVSQREIGTDIGELHPALVRVGRQNADVIFVSDIASPEVAADLVNQAAAGRFVIATMSTLSTTQTVRKLIEMFPANEQEQMHDSLASVLRGVVAQRLMERADGRGRVPAVEVLINTPKVAAAIRAGADKAALESLISDGEYHGMQTFDQALFQLYKDNLIGVREALSAATRPEDLRISLQSAGLAASY